MISICVLFILTIKDFTKYKNIIEKFDINNIPDFYSIKFDDEEIIIAERKFCWEDFSNQYIFKNYLILLNRDNTPVILSLSDESKKSLPDIIHKKSFDLKKKSLISMCILILICSSINVYINLPTFLPEKPLTEFDDEAGMVFVYSEQTSLGRQMETAFKETAEAHQCFNIYYSYIIKSEYNTLVKVYRDENYKYNLNPEVWFFDGDNCMFGLKLNSKTGNVTYVKGDNSVLISDEDNRIQIEEENIKSLPWQSKFIELTEYTKEKEAHTSSVNASPDGDAFIFSEHTEDFPPFIYTFRDDHFVYEEGYNNDKSYVILMKKVNKDKIKETEKLFYQLVEKGPKGSLDILRNEIYQYNSL